MRDQYSRDSSLTALINYSQVITWPASKTHSCVHTYIQIGPCGKKRTYKIWVSSENLRIQSLWLQLLQCVSLFYVIVNWAYPCWWLNKMRHLFFNEPSICLSHTAAHHHVNQVFYTDTLLYFQFSHRCKLGRCWPVGLVSVHQTPNTLCIQQ